MPCQQPGGRPLRLPLEQGIQALHFFLPGEEIAAIEPLGSGRINSTWKAVTNAGGQYVLQRLNPAVFPDPSLVQANLCLITGHIQAKLPPGSPFRVFRVLHSPTGATCWLDCQGVCWRLLSYLDGTQAIETISTPHQARELGAALGLFHSLLAGLPHLADPLPGFHDTALYLAQYDALLTAGCQQRESPDCREFIRERRHDMLLLDQAARQGRLSIQAVHGDPKAGNFLFSQDGRQVLSLIDLDTVRTGLLLHDIGDCLRSCCNPLGEEVESPDEVVFDQALCAALIGGYRSQASALLHKEEWQLIPASARVLSMELGLRFYTDYLAGSTYFKAAYPEQNLFRARIQFALARSIEQQAKEVEALLLVM